MSLHFDLKRLEKFKLENLKHDFNELKNNISKKDIIVLTILPVVMAILMVLPPNIRDQLKLNIHNPSWWQFFTSSFIHGNITHYWNNTGLFLLLVFLQIIIISKMKDKRRYFYLSVFVILSFPLISSNIQVAYYPDILPKIETSNGSSGIVAAFLGFIPVFWIECLSRSTNNSLADVRFFSIILLSVGFSYALIYYPYHQNVSPIFLTLSLMLVFAYSYRKNLKIIFKSILEENNTIFYFILLYLPPFFFIELLGLFPVKLVQESGLIDFGTHYLGVIYGFMISFIFLKAKLFKRTTRMRLGNRIS